MNQHLQMHCAFKYVTTNIYLHESYIFYTMGMCNTCVTQFFRCNNHCIHIVCHCTTSINLSLPLILPMCCPNITAYQMRDTSSKLLVSKLHVDMAFQIIPYRPRKLQPNLVFFWIPMVYHYTQHIWYQWWLSLVKHCVLVFNMVHLYTKCEIQQIFPSWETLFPKFPNLTFVKATNL